MPKRTDGGPAFATTKAAITGHGYLIVDARFDEASFGSWWIVIAADLTRFRVVWDGRERLLVLQQEYAPNSPADAQWVDIWLERTAESQTADQLLIQLDERTAA